MGGDTGVAPETEVPESQVISLSEWVSTRLHVDYGMPFAFDGRPYLKKIHDLEEKKILFRTGRQVEKTSSLAAKLVTLSCLRPNWKSLYVSPSQGQTRVFSHARLDRVLRSPYVRQKYFDPAQCVDFVYEKQMLNGSTILLSYASTDADRCIYGRAEVLLANGQKVTLAGMADNHMVGAEVVSWSERRNALTTSKVTAIHLMGERKVGRLRLSNGMEITCTPDHRFWTQRGYWREAQDLGNLKSHDREVYRVALGPGFSRAWGDVIAYEDAGVEEVYDLTVSNDYSYIANGFVVHNCRGISADALFLDEIQDMTSEIFPVLDAVLDHSPWGYRVYAGTPKTLNNSMETHWKNSTQCEWMIHCSCGEWVYQDQRMIKREGPTCLKCGKIVDPRFGRWAAMGKQDAEFMGFRIPQTMVPWIVDNAAKWKELFDKSEKWPTQQFHNEVLGLAHEKGANPLTESDIKAVCDPEKTILEVRDNKLYFDALYAGVDWGAGLGSFTVLSIVGWHGGKAHLQYMKRYADEKDEPNEQILQIGNTAKRFGCPLIACDWGGGYAQNKQLSIDMSGSADVIQMYESGVKKRDISYQKESRLYTFNRSMGLSMVFQAVKARDIIFPKWEDMAPFAPDFTGIFEDYNRALRAIVYDHPDGIPDDCVHSLMFALLAMKIARGDKAL